LDGSQHSKGTPKELRVEEFGDLRVATIVLIKQEAVVRETRRIRGER